MRGGRGRLWVKATPTPTNPSNPYPLILPPPCPAQKQQQGAKPNKRPKLPRPQVDALEDVTIKTRVRAAPHCPLPALWACTCAALCS